MFGSGKARNFVFEKSLEIFCMEYEILPTVIFLQEKEGSRLLYHTPAYATGQSSTKNVPNSKFYSKLLFNLYQNFLVVIALAFALTVELFNILAFNVDFVINFVVFLVLSTFF